MYQDGAFISAMHFTKTKICVRLICGADPKSSYHKISVSMCQSKDDDFLSLHFSSTNIKYLSGCKHTILQSNITLVNKFRFLKLDLLKNTECCIISENNLIKWKTYLLCFLEMVIEINMVCSVLGRHRFGNIKYDI